MLRCPFERRIRHQAIAMTHRTRLSILVGLATIHFAACGGRTLNDGTPEADGGQTTGATGTGASTMTSTGAGGSRVTGSGSTSGGVTMGAGGSTGSAGRAGAGGSSPCVNVACDAIACGPGFVGVIEPGTCCPVCTPVCNMACIVAPCPTGQHLETPPGACCAVCVPDKVTACEQGQKAYFGFRSMLIDKYNSIGCMTNNDCTLVYDANRCTASCGVAIPVSQTTNFVNNLRSFADSNCATCAPQPPPPCAASTVSCVRNRCTQGGP